MKSISIIIILFASFTMLSPVRLKPESAAGADQSVTSSSSPRNIAESDELVERLIDLVNNHAQEIAISTWQGLSDAYYEQMSEQTRSARLAVIQDVSRCSTYQIEVLQTLKLLSSEIFSDSALLSRYKSSFFAITPGIKLLKYSLFSVLPETITTAEDIAVHNICNGLFAYAISAQDAIKEAVIPDSDPTEVAASKLRAGGLVEYLLGIFRNHDVDQIKTIVNAISNYDDPYIVGKLGSSVILDCGKVEFQNPFVRHSADKYWEFFVPPQLHS